MENISLDKIVEIWGFTLKGKWVEVHLDATEQRFITSIYKEDGGDVSDKDRELINAWILTINNK